jgi:hypothetical protein
MAGEVAYWAAMNFVEVAEPCPAMVTFAVVEGSIVAAGRSFEAYEGGHSLAAGMMESSVVGKSLGTVVMVGFEDLEEVVSSHYCHLGGLESPHGHAPALDPLLFLCLDLPDPHGRDL